jgi:hypothetical protein
MSVIRIAEGYAGRPVTSLGTLDYAGWQLKLVGISYLDAEPRPALVDAAATAARAVLPMPAVTPDRYGLGFVGIHDGRGACFVFVDWWEAENELHHRTFTAPHDAPDRLVEVTGSGFAACAWDLAVISFERDAWVRTILANPTGPDPEAYLASRLIGQI